MKLSTKTFILLGIVQCIILTLFLILYLRYQQSLESQDPSSITERDFKVEP